MSELIACVLIAGFITGWLITVVYMSIVALRWIAKQLFPPDENDSR